MVLTKVKINKPRLPTLKKEDSFDKRLRESKERKEMEEAAAKKKEHDRIVEEKRLESITLPYMENLRQNLLDKELVSFWVFPDRAGFTKIKNTTFAQMQKLLYSDVDKYRGRIVAKINIVFIYRIKEGIIGISRDKQKIRMNVNIILFNILENGKLGGKDDSWGLDFHWRDEDFKTTKFTFKLLQTLMPLVVTRKATSFSLTSIGMPITNVVKELQRKKIDISYALIPLAGA